MKKKWMIRSSAKVVKFDVDATKGLHCLKNNFSSKCCMTEVIAVGSQAFGLLSVQVRTHRRKIEIM